MISDIERLNIIQDLIKENFENHNYLITHLEAWWLGLTTTLKLEFDEDEPLEMESERKDRASTVLDYEKLMEIVSSEYKTKMGVFTIYTILEWSRIFREEKGSIIPQGIINAWLNNTFYTSITNPFGKKMDAYICNSINEIKPNSTIICDFEIPAELKTEKKITHYSVEDIIKHIMLNLSFQQWRDFFRSIATMFGEKSPDTFSLTSFGYQIWVEWTNKSFYIYNPSFIPRKLYYIANISDEKTPEECKGMLVNSVNLWGNMLFSLMRSGLVGNDFDRFLSIEATNIAIPGNDTILNEELEKSKPGILYLTLNDYSKGGVNIKFSNCNDVYAVAELYRYLNKSGIVSLPHHQGNDILTGLPALASGVSSIKYKGMDIHVFERAVDDIANILNPHASLYQKTTTGTIKFDIDDM